MGPSLVKRVKPRRTKAPPMASSRSDQMRATCPISTPSVTLGMFQYSFGLREIAMATRYDANMDPECVALCDVLNDMPGVRTCESCCGHGRHSFRIWFEIDVLDALRPLLTAIYDDAPLRG